MTHAKVSEDSARLSGEPSPADGRESPRKSWGGTMLRTAIGIIVGAGLGFAYYKFIGCSTGACPITSNPWSSTLYGALMGALVSGGFGN